jgi:hypothetical protein
MGQWRAIVKEIINLYFRKNIWRFLSGSSVYFSKEGFSSREQFVLKVVFTKELILNG